MPAVKSEKFKASGSTRQLTLTGKPAPIVDASTSKSKSKSKSKVERAFTDAILCIKPEFSQLIESREKNHEYRKYTLRPTVVRLWLYESVPTSAITSVMVTGPPKVPGEVCDSSGVGNDDFDLGHKESKFGYPVLGLYKLKEPMTPDVMKSKYSMPVPQGYFYAPKQMVDDLPLQDMIKVF